MVRNGAIFSKTNILFPYVEISMRKIAYYQGGEAAGFLELLQAIVRFLQ